MTTAHVFIATSLDGYIARPDGDIDWLLARDDASEDHGYTTFIADKRAIVMGRGTYEKALSFDGWPYAQPVVVLTRTLTQVPQALRGRVRFSDQAPSALMQEFAQQGIDRVYVDGGQVVQAFLRAGLVTDMVLTVVPVLIGAGKPLFGALTGDVSLALTGSRHFASGLVQSTYRVLA